MHTLTNLRVMLTFEWGFLCCVGWFDTFGRPWIARAHRVMYQKWRICPSLCEAFVRATPCSLDSPAAVPLASLFSSHKIDPYWPNLEILRKTAMLSSQSALTMWILPFLCRWNEFFVHGLQGPSWLLEYLAPQACIPLHTLHTGAHPAPFAEIFLSCDRSFRSLPLHWCCHRSLRGCPGPGPRVVLWLRSVVICCDPCAKAGNHEEALFPRTVEPGVWPFSFIHFHYVYQYQTFWISGGRCFGRLLLQVCYGWGSGCTWWSVSSAMQVIGGGGWSTGRVSPMTIQSSTYPEVLRRVSNSSLGMIILGAMYECFLSSCLYDHIAYIH